MVGIFALHYLGSSLPFSAQVPYVPPLAISLSLICSLAPGQHWAPQALAEERTQEPARASELQQNICHRSFQRKSLYLVSLDVNLAHGSGSCWSF